MTDKERILHIAGKIDKLYSLSDSEGNGEVNILSIKNDMYWLIEKVEKQQQESEHWKKKYEKVIDAEFGYSD